MGKNRKKFLLVSALFVLLTQTLIGALSGISVVAITQQETEKELFQKNDYVQSTASYSRINENKIKWTVVLKKSDNEQRTRFSVELTADGNPVIPENIQTENEENSNLAFSNVLDESNQASNRISESKEGTNLGSAKLTFETAANFKEMKFSPNLVKVGQEGENTLGQIPATIFNLAPVQTTDDNQAATGTENPEETIQQPVDPEKPEIDENSNSSNQESSEKSSNPAKSATMTEGKTGNSNELKTFSEPLYNIQANDVTRASNPENSIGSTEPGITTGMKNQGKEFKYRTDSNGSYPEFNDASNHGENVRNYNYGSNEDPNSSQNATAVKPGIVTGDQNFSNGFLDYGDAGLRKWVTQVPGNPNQFDITLETIGNDIFPIPTVNITLVLDASISMGDIDNRNSNFYALNGAITNFVDSVTKDTGINANVSAVFFGGYRSSGTDINDGIVADSKKKDSVIKVPFSKDGKLIKTALNRFKRNSNPQYATNYTPIQQGLISATNQLTEQAKNQPGKNYLLFFGDGTANIALDTDGNIFPADKDQVNGSPEITNYTNEYINNTLKEIWDANGIAREAVLYNYSSGNEAEARAKSTLKAIVGENKAVYEAGQSDQLTQLFKGLGASLSKTIQSANLADPLSEYVSFVKGSLKSEGLKLTSSGLAGLQAGDYNAATNAKISFNERTKTIEGSGISVGKKDGLRITYQVELKEQYRDGKFYLANGPTYLMNGTDNPNKDKIHYAIPAVRGNPKVSTLNIQKTSNIEGGNVKGAVFNLYVKDSQDAVASVISDETGKGAFKTNGTEYKLVANTSYVVKELTAPTGHIKTEADYEFNVLPNGTVTFTEGHGFSYVDGKLTLTVENKFQELTLKLKKVNEAGKNLPNAKFGLYHDGEKDPIESKETNDSGDIEFEYKLSPGTYFVKEEKAPLGYQISDETWTFTVLEDGSLSTKDGFILNEGVVSKEVKNSLKDFDLTVNKVDENSTALSGAKFELKQVNPTGNTPVPESSNDDGTSFTFEKLRAGEYELTETEAPEGYVKGKTVKIIIKEDGNVSVSGDSDNDLKVVINAEGNNTISFNVVNKPKVPLPATGGSGIWLILLTGGIAVTAAGIYFLRRKDQGVA
ncbi:SpaA isopeptide-forming pilin-related protein [Enterococcus sp. AD013-P3]|uniref:SpaA isopeptide-forming pilin-related protein n=1 Tax=Enterococcus sp. AD013-P3 TaxID=3411036 RepID=UPI003B941D9D